MSAPVSYLAIGHVTKDLTPDGPRLGGSVAYAALTARALGYPAGVVTACADDLDLGALDGVPVRRQPSPHSTTYENLYTPAGRTQYLRGRAAPLGADAVPREWRPAPLVHLAPLTGELDPVLTAAFPDALIGLTPQGFLRGWDDSGRVHPRAWEAAEQWLPRAGAVVLSLEDAGGDWALLERWARLAHRLVVTEGPRGCTVFVRGQGARQFAGPPQTEVDPTGAGDIFAAAFFIHLYETDDPWAAARVANQVAGVSVTRAGLAGVPTVDEAGLARLRAEQT